jgi:cellulose synthase/poly-beta-1,6-N-acetylglucosamine synthase-like glycosyltransferase/peptidoglycan/xylan/chitin deacetylase (PgdA/CDA1 family)/peptidoglycan/LPS O-acetylase OafA/YrhL
MTRSSPQRRTGHARSWLFTGVLLVLFAAILVVSGFANSRVGNDARARDEGSSDQVPRSVLEGGSVVDGTRNPVVSSPLKPGTIALTFDDGPDPTWTPQVLAVLQKHRVPGTFFVVGSMASRHPDLIRAIHDSGSELGVHTFSHPDLGVVSRWRFNRELDETQLVIAGATGRTTYLMRPPFSAGVSSLDNLGFKTVQAGGERGYVNIFTDDDTEDWKRPGVDTIVRNSYPTDNKSAVVLLHDAGGDRSQTVAALDRLIPELQRQGYRFTTVTDGAGLRSANEPANRRDLLLGKALLGTIGVAEAFLSVLYWILIVIGALVVLRLVLMVTVARRHAKRRHDPNWSWGPPVTEPVSVIVPAYNEREDIEATVRSILANDHPLEVIVVDDGSTDGTADIVEGLALPGVRVIRQANSGKSTALNTGIRAARYELVIMMDGDTVFEQDTVRRIVQPFSDPAIGAVAGNVKVANRSSLVARMQHIEYVVGFNVDRRVQDSFGSIATIPGAAGAFRRRALIDVGGLSEETLAEDTDLTIALGRAGWRVVYEEHAVAWTEAPVTLAQLWRQRYRWSYGTMQAVWKHRRAMREKGSSGRLGRFGLAHLILFHVLLPLSAPLVDLLFVYGLLFLDPAMTILLWLGMLVIQLAGAAYAFHLDGERKEALWVFPVQQLMYRQLMYVVLVQSVVSALSGVVVRWQKLHRVGGLDALLPTPHEPSAASAVATVQSQPRSGSVDTQPDPATPLPVRPENKPAGTKLTTATRPKNRERWLDLLRAAALVRVVAYHVFGTGWLSLVYPSMGVMFALGGSLMAQSMRRSAPVDVVGSRLRRLLPPLWLLGLILVPLMLWRGWVGVAGGSAFRWQDLLFWIFPLLDPPGSKWVSDATAVLWYIRAYLWFLLLTPLMLRAFRRRPVVAILAPVCVVAVNALLGSPLQNFGQFGPGLLDFFTFAACWMLGFAHREGMLRKMRPLVLIGLTALAFGLGGAWTFTHPAPDVGYDLNEIPLGQALISAGAVLLFLRVSPRLDWLDRTPVLGRLVTVINARAMTIYLWHNIAIALAVPVNDRLAWYSQGALFGTGVGLTVVAVLMFGWVEDLAARRRVQLIPGGKRKDKSSKPPSDRAGSHRAGSAVAATAGSARGD